MQTALRLATTHPLVAELLPNGSKAEQLMQQANHTQYIPVLPQVLHFEDPVAFGNKVYAQVVLMLSLAVNNQFQQKVGKVAAQHAKGGQYIVNCTL